MPANIFHPLETVVTSEGMTPYQQGRFAIGFDAAQSGHAWQEGKGGRLADHRRNSDTASC